MLIPYLLLGTGFCSEHFLQFWPILWWEKSAGKRGRSLRKVSLLIKRSTQEEAASSSSSSGNWKHPNHLTTVTGVRLRPELTWSKWQSKKIERTWVFELTHPGAACLQDVFLCEVRSFSYCLSHFESCFPGTWERPSPLQNWLLVYEVNKSGMGRFNKKESFCCESSSNSGCSIMSVTWICLLIQSPLSVSALASDWLPSWLQNGCFQLPDLEEEEAASPWMLLEFGDQE